MTREPSSVREGRTTAEALRYQCDLGDAPIRDLFGFIERTQPGVHVVRRPMPDGPEGALLQHAGGWLIVVNTFDRYLARQRFTAAHELGHLHFDADQHPVHVDNTLFDSRPSERRANAFAVHLLLPADVLRARFDAPGFDVDDPDDVVALAMEYGLSLESLSWHLLNVCGISEQRRRRISEIEPFRTSMRMGLADRVEKERAASNAYEWPREYFGLVARAYDRGIVGRDELHDYLEDEHLVRQLLDTTT
jgi:Zn-dependent peptidase ImmA (M78 family)